MENARISGWQYFLLVLNILTGTAFFLRPGFLAAVAKQNSWLLPLWAGGIGLLMACLWLYLANRHPGLSIVQISMQVAGNKLGAVIAVLYIWYFVQIASWVTRNLGDFMKTAIMPRTPISVFHLMFLAIACYAAIKGVETIARVHEFLSPVLVFIVVAALCFTFSEWKWENLQPVFQLDVWKTVKETRSFIGFPYMEAISMMMLFPYVKSKAKAGLLLGIGISAIALSLVMLVTICYLGVYRASHMTYPLYHIAQELQIGPYFEHLESTITITWLIGIFFKLSLAFYCAVLGICQLFRLSDRTWIAMPLVLVVSGFAITFSENVLDNTEWDKRYTFEYMTLYGIILPLVLVFSSWLRMRHKQRRGLSG